MHTGRQETRASGTLDVMFSGISGDSNAAYFCSVLHHLALPEKLKQTGSHFMLSITRKG